MNFQSLRMLWGDKFLEECLAEAALKFGVQNPSAELILAIAISKILSNKKRERIFPDVY